MFEKEALEKGKYYDWNCNVDNTKAERIWKDGAEFGYNKANEWHYVKDGLPKMSTKFIYCSDDLIFLTKDCCGNIKKNFGYFNSRKRFEEYNTGYEFISDKVIAWKEIILPELLKESE